MYSPRTSEIISLVEEPTEDDIEPTPNFLKLRGQQETIVSLSHTCQLLRSYCLPILWRHLAIDSISLLSHTRHLFLPEFGPFVKVFTFKWQLEEIQYLQEERFDGLDDRGPLQYAFIDRAPLPREFRSKYFHHLKEDYDIGGDWYKDKMEAYNDPDRLGPTFSSGKAIPYSCKRTLLTASGPDGEGPVKGMEGPQDVESALLHIIKHSPNIEFLDWDASLLPIPPSIGSRLSRLENLHTIRLRNEGVHEEDNFSDIYDCLKTVRHLSFLKLSGIDLPRKGPGAEEAWIRQDPSETFGVRIHTATRSNESAFLKFFYASILEAAKHKLDDIEIEPEYIRGYDIPILFTNALLPLFVGGLDVVLCLKWNNPSSHELRGLLRIKYLDDAERSIEAIDMLRERFADCKNAEEMASVAEDIYNTTSPGIFRGYAKLFAQDDTSINERVLKAREFLRGRKCGT